MKTWPPALLITLASAAAQAAPAYRCGPGVYSQTPCQGGSVVEATDPRSAAQRAEARRQHAAQRQTAKQLEKERLDFEKQGREAPALGAVGPQQAASAAGEKAVKGRRESKKKSSRADREASATKDFTAVVPPPRKAAVGP
jgi:hypothetical protein